MKEEKIMSLTEAIKGGFSGLIYYLADLDLEMFIIWCIVAAVDVIVGVLHALINKDFSSRVMSEGMIYKIMEFFFLVAVTLAQRALAISGINIAATTMVVGAFVFKDIGSIIETLIEGGVTFPKAVIQWFEVANDKINNNEKIDP